MPGLDLLRGHELGGISVEASGSEEAAPSTSAPSTATGPAHRTRRSWSAEEKARIVAESDRPGVVQKEVAARHGISEKTVRTWRRHAASGTGGDREGAGSAPPYIPLVVDAAGSEQTVSIEALGVVVRLPVESAVDRIVAVASGLGRASS